jgi:hypothetical protein
MPSGTTEAKLRAWIQQIEHWKDSRRFDSFIEAQINLTIAKSRVTMVNIEAIKANSRTEFNSIIAQLLIARSP